MRLEVLHQVYPGLLESCIDSWWTGISLALFQGVMLVVLLLTCQGTAAVYGPKCTYEWTGRDSCVLGKVEWYEFYILVFGRSCKINTAVMYCDVTDVSHLKLWRLDQDLELGIAQRQWRLFALKECISWCFSAVFLFLFGFFFSQ